MYANTFNCWTPAIPVKRQDNIISSEFASLKVFTPSYEKEPYVCMEQLMANEYQRIWLLERDEWARKTFNSKNGKTNHRRSTKTVQKGKENSKDKKKSEKRKAEKPIKKDKN